LIEGEGDHDADIWALGALYYRMVTGFTPFNSFGSEQLMDEKLENGVFYFPTSVNMPFEGLLLINRMLLKDKSRITIDELAASPYIMQTLAEDEVIARAGRAEHAKFLERRAKGDE